MLVDANRRSRSFGRLFAWLRNKTIRKKEGWNSSVSQSLRFCSIIHCFRMFCHGFLLWILMPRFNATVGFEGCPYGRLVPQREIGHMTWRGDDRWRTGRHISWPIMAHRYRFAPRRLPGDVTLPNDTRFIDWVAVVYSSLTNNAAFAQLRWQDFGKKRASWYHVSSSTIAWTVRLHSLCDSVVGLLRASLHSRQVHLK